MDAGGKAFPRQWAYFLSELDRQQIDFECIQHADEASRAGVIDSICGGISPLDRAVISSTWSKLAVVDAGASDATAASYLPPGASPAVGPAAAATGVSNRSGAVGRNTSSSSVLPGLGLGGAFGAAPDPLSLRAAFNRGDCVAALPLASDLLQRDPATLVAMLHEYLPHIGEGQLRGLLGLTGVAAAATAVPGPSSGSAGSPQSFAAMSSMAFDLGGVIGGGGTNGGAGNSSVVSGAATLNNEPLVAGQVLTSQALAAQFGAGYTATCNGVFLHLPYCVQRGDTIAVRPLNARHL